MLYSKSQRGPGSEGLFFHLYYNAGVSKFYHFIPVFDPEITHIFMNIFTEILVIHVDF